MTATQIAHLIRYTRQALHLFYQLQARVLMVSPSKAVALQTEALAALRYARLAHAVLKTVEWPEDMPAWRVRLGQARVAWLGRQLALVQHTSRVNAKAVKDQAKQASDPLRVLGRKIKGGAQRAWKQRGQWLPRRRTPEDEAAWRGVLQRVHAHPQAQTQTHSQTQHAQTQNPQAQTQAEAKAEASA